MALDLSPAKDPLPRVDLTPATTDQVQETALNRGIQVTNDPEFSYDYSNIEPSDWNIKRAALTGLNYIIDGLDYANNISRTMIMAGLKGQDLWKEGGKAARYEKRVYSDELRREVGNRLGIDLEFSQKKGEIDIGDIPDFIADVVIDVATDPLTYVSMGASKVIGKLAKTARKGLAKKSQAELAETITPRIKEKIAQPIIKEEAGKFKTKIKYKMPDSPEATIKLGKELNVLDDIEIQNAALKAYQDVGQVAGIQTAKDAYAGLMGGLFYSAANADEEHSIPELATNFAIGAAAVGGGRRYIRRNPWVKSRVAEIGRKLNEAVHPNDIVKAQVEDAAGNKKTISTKVKGWMMSQIAALAGVKAQQSAVRIIRPFTEVIQDIKAADPVGAATQLSYIKQFDNFLTDIKVNEWKQTLRNMDSKQLADLGIQVEKKTIKDPRTNQRAVATIYPDMSKAKSEGARKIKKNIDDGIRQKYFERNAEGQLELNRAAMLTWLGNVNGELADRTIGNLNAWKRAVDKSWEIEKEIADEAYQRLISPDELYDIVIKDRRQSITEYNKSEGASFGDITTYGNVKKGMDMNMANDGLLFWTPRIGERSLGHTAQAAEAGKALYRTPKGRKSLSDKIENGARDFLGRDQAKAFQDIQSIENAKRVIASTEDALSIAAANKSRLALNVIEREAASYTGSVAANQKVALEALGRMNGLVKSGLLLGGYSWIKNNFWSNARQAYANAGIFGLIDIGKTFDFASDLHKDLRKIYWRKPGEELPGALKWKSADLDDMYKYGVIDDPTWRDIAARRENEENWKFLWDEKTKEDIAKRKGQFRWLEKAEKAADRWSRILGTRQLGSFIESMARGTLWQRNVKMLTDETYDVIRDVFGHDAAMDAIKKQAAQITNDVFFDYGKLNYWERSVARQFIPFYSFYKQNLFYQTKALFDPTKTKDVAALAKTGTGRYFGADQITGEERDTLPEYLRQNNVMRWTDKDGQQKLIFSTSDASLQAQQMLSSKYWYKDFVGQINPAIKSIFEQLMNYDAFRGEPFDPKMLSQSPERQIKYLFSRGYAVKPIYNAIASALSSTDSPVWIDVNGNPVTDQEWVARVDNIMSWLAAQYVSAPAQLYAAHEKMKRGKASKMDTLFNLVGMYSFTQEIPGQQERGLKRVEEEKLEDFYQELRRTNIYSK